MDTAHFKKMLLAKERELLDAIARQNAADAVTLDQVEASGAGTIEREKLELLREALYRGR